MKPVFFDAFSFLNKVDNNYYIISYAKGILDMLNRDYNLIGLVDPKKLNNSLFAKIFKKTIPDVLKGYNIEVKHYEEWKDILYNRGTLLFYFNYPSDIILYSISKERCIPLPYSYSLAIEKINKILEKDLPVVTMLAKDKLSVKESFLTKLFR